VFGWKTSPGIKWMEGKTFPAAAHSRLRHIPGCGTDLQLSADIGMQLSADIGIQPSADVEGFSSSIRCITVWWQEGIALPG
jgi:hypothetical protein